MVLEQMIEKCDKAKFNVMLHYLRRISFAYADKNSLFNKMEQKLLSGKPEIMAQVNVVGHNLRDNIFESIMEIRVKASINGTEVYNVDFHYATVVSIDEIEKYSDEERQYISTVRVGQMSFPFARRILFDVTRDSGSTPISLDPIDFYHMYMESKKNKEVAKQSNNEMESVFVDSNAETH